MNHLCFSCSLILINFHVCVTMHIDIMIEISKVRTTLCYCDQVATRKGPFLISSYNFQYYYLKFKGAGGVGDPGKFEIKFSVVPDREECQLPDTFYQIKKYCS